MHALQTDPDLSTLRVLLEDHPGAARQLLGALPGMCQHALRMPQLFPADVLPVLQAGQNGEVELSRTQVNRIIWGEGEGRGADPPALMATALQLGCTLICTVRVQGKAGMHLN